MICPLPATNGCSVTANVATHRDNQDIIDITRTTAQRHFVDARQIQPMSIVGRAEDLRGRDSAPAVPSSGWFVEVLPDRARAREIRRIA